MKEKEKERKRKRKREALTQFVTREIERERERPYVCVWVCVWVCSVSNDTRVGCVCRRTSVEALLVRGGAHIHTHTHTMMKTLFFLILIIIIIIIIMIIVTNKKEMGHPSFLSLFFCCLLFCATQRQNFCFWVCAVVSQTDRRQWLIIFLRTFIFICCSAVSLCVCVGAIDSHTHTTKRRSWLTFFGNLTQPPSTVVTLHICAQTISHFKPPFESTHFLLPELRYSDWNLLKRYPTKDKHN